MLGVKDVQLKQTRFYQEIDEEERREGKLEGMQEGKQEGIREGIQKERQEGRQEGEIRFLSKLLNKRFGPLPEPELEKLRQADIAQLELWGAGCENA